jgi:hypothetical protein
MDLMDIAQLLGNFGEFVGAIAVVATLAYLAVQIRQNTQSVKSSTLAINTSNWSSMLVNLASDDKSEAYLNGISGKEDISPTHFLQFVQIARAMFVSFETQHYQFLHGAMDKEIYFGYEQACKDQMLAFPGFQIVWQITRDGFSPAFAELVDRLIGELTEADSFTLITAWQQLARERNAG